MNCLSCKSHYKNICIPYGQRPSFVEKWGTISIIQSLEHCRGREGGRVPWSPVSPTQTMSLKTMIPKNQTMCVLVYLLPFNPRYIKILP